MGIEEKKDYLDILWKSIIMQYETIIRTQRICFVDEKDKITKEIKSEEEGLKGNKTTYDIVYPWQRQTKLLEAQSKALGSLKNLIGEYEKLLHKSKLNGIDIEKADIQLRALKEEMGNGGKFFPEIRGEDDLSS